MPRRLLKRITPHPSKLQNRWFLRMFGPRVTNPRLWSLQRRSVTSAFGLGLAICFIPLPVHLPLAVLVAIAGVAACAVTGSVGLLVGCLLGAVVVFVVVRVGAEVVEVIADTLLPR